MADPDCPTVPGWKGLGGTILPATAEAIAVADQKVSPIPL
ncbi:MAG: hypothetical protein ACI9R3_004445 [Verrucomicrobiales bacterium]|jgi:hypothetical protein